MREFAGSVFIDTNLGDCGCLAVTGLGRRADADDLPVRATYLVNALRPVMALPTTRVLISLVPS